MTAYEALMKYYPLTLDDLPGEKFKPIPDYEELYHESNYGRTKSFWSKIPRILKPQNNNQGYMTVILCKDGKKKFFLVHRLVALTFIPNPQNKPQVNHRDGHPLNCHVSNLEWVTSSENVHHALDTGLIPQGEDCSWSKLTAEQVRFIRDNPDRLMQDELAEMFGVANSTISKIQRGETHKTADGPIRKVRVRSPSITVKVREQIRAEYKEGVRGYGCKSLAKKYGVDPTTIIRIVRED